MKKRSLVTIGLAVAMAIGALGGPSLWAQGHVSGGTTFGTVIPLPGIINDVAVDEARGLVYAGNFSAGRVEVVSMATHQRIGSFVTTPQPAAMVGMAMSVDSRYLVTLNAPVTSGVSQLSGVTAVNLNDPVDRRHYPMVATPVAVTFAKNGEAVIITTTGIVFFDPDDGAFRDLVEFSELDGPEAPGISLPVAPATFPRTINTASMDRNTAGTWIFGMTDSFIFSYQVSLPVGLMTIRINDTLITPPAFNQLSASGDGQYFLAGHLLFNRRLRVIADTPEAVQSADGLIGGSVIDPASGTVYISFDKPSGVEPIIPGAPAAGLLEVMELDNMLLRSQLLLPERLGGRLASDLAGRNLYAIGQSGLTHIALDELAEAPVMEYNPDDRRLFFQFDFCNRDVQAQTLRIENPGGSPAQFSLSVLDQRSSGRPAVLFEPHTGTTPANVRVSVDPGALGPVQGTSVFPIVLQTNAVNIPREAEVFANVRDVDQKGTLYTVPGRFVDIVADRFRDRFYVLDQEGFQVLVFDSSFRLGGRISVGNTPTWMLVSPDGGFLIVANAQSETMTLINLNTLRVETTIFLPWESLGGGRYPLSLAADAGNILLTMESSGGGSEIGMFNLHNKIVTNPDTLGIFTNSFSSDSAVVGAPDGSGVLIAESTGGVHFWEALSSRITLTRDELPSLSGAIGAGANFFLVDNHVLNASLVEIAALPGAEAGQASAGFAVLPDSTAVRSIRPRFQVDTGALQRHDPRDPTRLTDQVRMVEPPPPPSDRLSFYRSLTALRDGRLVSTSSAGVVEFPASFDATLQIPRIAGVTNAADFSTKLGAGGLITIFGENLSGQTASATDTPLPNRLTEVCVTANGANLPLLFVSPEQINAQLQFFGGNAGVQVHTQGGVSDIFLTNVLTAAPAVFSVPGPSGNTFAAVIREDNTLVTLSSPLRHHEIAVIYSTGLGPVTPIAFPGHPASSEPLSVTVVEPTVTFGGVTGRVLYSGLTPGFVGLYQINVEVPGGSPLGIQVPVEIDSGGVSSTINVRVVD